MQVGANIPLYFQHPSGDATKYVQAVVKKPDGTQLADSPVYLIHQGNGQYKSLALTMPNASHVVAQYLVYDDDAYTIRTDDQAVVTERFDLDPPSAGSLAGATCNIVGVLEDEENGNKKSGIQDRIVAGSDRTLLIRLLKEVGGEPVDLSAAQVVECRFKNRSGAALSVKSTDGGSPVTVLSPGAGKLSCVLTATQTANLNPGRPAAFSVVVTYTDGSKVVCNLTTQLAIEAQSV